MHRPIQLVRKIYYLKMAVFGVPVNVLAIVVLSQGKCGLSPCITLYLVAMAAADLLAIITDVILHRINDYYFPLNFLSITPVCSVRYVLLRAAIDCSVWFTVSFTFDRFGAICYQKLKTRYCTKKTAAVVLSTTGTLLCLKNIPIYFRFKPKVIIDNVPFFCSNKRSYFTDPRWIGFRRFEKVLTPLIPFGLILFLNILTVKHIFKVSRIRKGLKCQNKALDHSDPEMGNRRKSVILLFSISGSFILLWQGCPEAWYIGETEQRLRQRMNGHRTTINRQEGSLPVGEHFSGPGHSTSDLRVTILQGGLQDRQQRKVAEQRLIANREREKTEYSNFKVAPEEYSSSREYFNGISEAPEHRERPLDDGWHGAVLMRKMAFSHRMLEFPDVNDTPRSMTDTSRTLCIVSNAYSFSIILITEFAE
ncbi:uncharacterized protein [Chiloscyllium punctatum]|uniref:uncharacterized protein n=1 Tax=Chiloscyllium punctatum TaxID=137246 RepID=UPI003B6427D7